MNSHTPQAGSFPVPPERVFIRRRVIFSHNIANLNSHFIQSDDDLHTPAVPRRHVDDESLRLIDNLTNRPVDPLFEDSRLIPRGHRSQASIWFNRIIIFLICVAVGLGGTVIVDALHKDPRRKIREKLIAQIQTTNQRSNALQEQIADLNKDIDTVTQQVGAAQTDNTKTDNHVLNGTVSVHGQGIRLTITNPLIDNENQEKTSQGNLVTDTELQWFTSQLWSAGAEAIAINNKRIGSQTSIRIAGQTVLVGTDSVQSPYVIEAIGNSQELTKQFSHDEQKDYLKNLRAASITLQITSVKDITLSFVGGLDVTYAKRSE